MKRIKSIAFSAIILTSIISCSNENKKTSSTTDPMPENAAVAVGITGSYATPDYAKRNDGYDWVGVTVNQGAGNAINIAVRSRADKKKPTCTMDLIAYKQNDNVYTGVAEGKNIVVTFSDNTVAIATEKKEDEAALNFYCSGGGTVAGTYTKMDGPLDETQVDKTQFSKVLHMKDMDFTISSIKKGYNMELSVTPFGANIKTSNTTIKNIDGYVVNAEIEDLNADGNPELLIYTASEGTGSYGNVVGYSVASNGTLTSISFPAVSENAKINNGYMGHDEFSLVETSLAQRFPIYKEGDANAKATGGTRQVEYKLVKDKSGYKFEMTKSSDS